jgi:hypothetical protein
MTGCRAKSDLFKAEVLLVAFLLTVSGTTSCRVAKQQYFANTRKPVIAELTSCVKRNTNELFVMKKSLIRKKSCTTQNYHFSGEAI